jgi:hypothetical protein
MKLISNILKLLAFDKFHLFERFASVEVFVAAIDVKEVFVADVLPNTKSPQTLNELAQHHFVTRETQFLLFVLKVRYRTSESVARRSNVNFAAATVQSQRHWFAIENL